MSDLNDKGKGQSRRRILKAVGTSLVAGAGIVGMSGTAMAGNCDSFMDAPSDFPYVKDGKKYGDYPKKASEVTYFIHGWNVGSVELAQDQAYTCKKALEQNGYTKPVVAVRWPSDTLTWAGGKDNANEAGHMWADFVRKENNKKDTIRSIGHSLGARVTCVALEDLHDEYGETYTSADLIGGAIEQDFPAKEGHWGDDIAGAVGQFHNYFNEDDQVLDDTFQTRELDAAVGEEGLDGTPVHNYTDVDVTDQVDAHCDYFRPDIGCMDRVVANW
ncbi:DUF726 domain-containing protein [Natrinema sp. 1APR25-10V2]|uniref:DUF726 domain-containing protein n=1 Tax=Natrinema sp. 1APR25-10V2 TaxID=2951081 RepID=UPI0028769E2A|nr:DUF726 domain-containing protein [Natrinema sp. 1APR25-10V2]MDS0475991.1 TMCO4 family protein [Natrinema sp. 1APR25-10V2]